ncbi:MAG: hypothetical protein HY023_02470 [Chloroflexi bacterium]|nr:hypothetical protein [Chloroflexota bacterium]
MTRERIRQRRVQSLIRATGWVAGIAVAAVIVLIALGPKPLPTVTIPTEQPRPYAGQGKTLGKSDAPVVFEEYSDFQ